MKPDETMTDDPWRYRRFRAPDAETLAGIYRAAVEQRARLEYSPAQIAAWLSLAPSAAQIADSYGDGRVALVATDVRDQAVGFADLQADGHIQYLYVDPRLTGRGIASALLTRLESEARTVGLRQLSAEASEAAVSVFERAGFRRRERRELTIGEVAIHNYAVVKVLR